MPTKSELQSRLDKALADIANLHAQDSAPIRDPAGAELAIRKQWDVGALEEEHFWAVLLNSRQQVIRVHEVARGTLSQVDVHPRELFREAIRMRVHSIILAHNHPSGDVAPSHADDNLTARMSDAGKILGIPVLDHLVLTATSSYSYAAHGWESS